MTEWIRADELGYEDWGRFVHVDDGGHPYQGILNRIEHLDYGRIILIVGRDRIEVQPELRVGVDLG